MGTAFQVPAQVVYEDNMATPLARIRGHNGTYLSQAAFSGGSIDYKAYDTADPATVVQSGTLTVSDVVFDTLQTSDPRWTLDSTGYNFAFDVWANWFPDPDKIYVIEVKFTPTAGAGYVFHAVFEIRTRNLRRS